MTTTYGRRNLDGSPADQDEPSDYAASERTWCRACCRTLSTDRVCPTHGTQQ